MRNFLILFQGREGSSPIISHISRHPKVKVPLFEHLDKSNVKRNFQKLNEMDFKIGKVLDKIFSSGQFSYDMFLEEIGDYPERQDIIVGFKWRIWGDPLMIATTLKKNNVIVYRLIRKNIINQCISAYFSEILFQDDFNSGIHPQFHVINMDVDQQKDYLQKIRRKTFSIEPDKLISLMKKRIYNFNFIKNNYLTFMKKMEISFKCCFYEDFLENKKEFLDAMVNDLGIEKNERIYTSKFKKVHRKNITDQVDNFEKIMAVPKVLELENNWKMLIEALCNDLNSPQKS